MNLKKLRSITENELHKHNTRESCWVVIDGLVYDLTNWLNKHPGGGKIIGHFAGQDATDAWMAMHLDRTYASKFLGSYLIGRIDEDTNGYFSDVASQSHTITRYNKELVKDFRMLRGKVEAMGLMDADIYFFTFQLIHILIIEIIAYYLIRCFGGSPINFIITSLLLATAQAQSGWTQHDYGHYSIFKSSRLNRFMHYFVICHMKGASKHWWNFRHNQHHAKPNVLRKDPDVAVAKLFLLGDVVPRVWGEMRRGSMPYHWQHVYFWIIGPPLLLPIYFHYENVLFMWRRKDWLDALWVLSFFCRFFYLYSPLIGWRLAFALYMFARMIESFWFVLVTQMNHIVMAIEKDHEDDWVTSQFKATCNVKGSKFNDWFTGGLNYQIEHHLFPTMPRHNYPKVAPFIKQLSIKHNLCYIEKSLSTAVLDIHRSLKNSGQIWWKHFNVDHKNDGGGGGGGDYKFSGYS